MRPLNEVTPIITQREDVLGGARRHQVKGIQIWSRGSLSSYLPGRCLTGCCFQSRWWYYILSGWRRRGSPVGASRRPGEVCWSLQGAAHAHTHRHTRTHTHKTYTQMISTSQPSHKRTYYSPPAAVWTCLPSCAQHWNIYCAVVQNSGNVCLMLHWRLTVM